MIYVENRTKDTIKIDIIEHIAQAITSKDIELIICDNKYIKELNFQFRGQDKPTDVLSFPLDDMGLDDVPLGSIVISVDFVKEKSQQYQHSFDDEFTLLFIHGLLHLLGYDHEVDDGEHRKKEEELIKQFNLPDSLIVRNS